MKTSNAGIHIIMKYEGCRLKAYKALPTEKYYTIGYGHYGADVSPTMVITQTEAIKLLQKDLKKFESLVNKKNLNLTQNMFDALVSFTYNCGGANLDRLVYNRSLKQIAEAMLKYNKAGGKIYSGLTKRRKEEHDLFLKDYKEIPTDKDYEKIAREVIDGQWGNGKVRKDRLTEAGYDYKTVQTIVNRIITNG